MDMTRYRPDFSVTVLDAHFQTNQALVEAIRASGYGDVQFYPTMEACLAVSRQNPPHIILVDGDGFSDAIEPFLMEVQSISREIMVILMVQTKQKMAATQLVSRGLAYDYLVRPTFSTLDVIQKLDRAIRQLYSEFESEQLRAYIHDHESPNDDKEESTGLTATHRTVSRGSMADQKLFEAEEWEQFLTRLQDTNDLDKTIQVYIDQLSRLSADTPVLYLKYLPSHTSLLVAMASWLPIEKFRGVGVDLKEGDVTRLQEYLTNPQTLPALREMILHVFGEGRFTAFSHIYENTVHGVFVVLEKVDWEDSTSYMAPVRTAFDIVYRRNMLLKEKHSLDITDSATGLLNRRQFGVRLDEEISRSRRLKLPVSLVTFAIDDFYDWTQKVGAQQTDSILKAVALILKKTSRPTDILARTGPDELSGILPHTGHMGAVVKAERTRKLMEATKVPLLEKLGLGPLRVSLGVSEYPTFCHDAEGLVRSTDEALYYVRQQGGNKTCLAMAPDGFTKDFEPLQLIHSSSQSVDFIESAVQAIDDSDSEVQRAKEKKGKTPEIPR